MSEQYNPQAETTSPTILVKNHETGTINTFERTGTAELSRDSQGKIKLESTEVSRQIDDFKQKYNVTPEDMTNEAQDFLASELSGTALIGEKVIVPNYDGKGSKEATLLGKTYETVDPSDGETKRFAYLEDADGNEVTARFTDLGLEKQKEFLESHTEQQIKLSAAAIRSTEQYLGVLPGDIVSHDTAEKIRANNDEKELGEIEAAASLAAFTEGLEQNVKDDLLSYASAREQRDKAILSGDKEVEDQNFNLMKNYINKPSLAAIKTNDYYVLYKQVHG